MKLSWVTLDRMVEQKRPSDVLYKETGCRKDAQ